jgi:hypothetical protein
MIRFWPKNKKSGNTMPAGGAKEQATAMPEMAMPETLMPETVKLGKTIGRPEPHMPALKCRRRDIQEAMLRRQAGTMRLIPG